MPQRRFPWARLVLAVGIVAALAYVLLPRYFYLDADALVQGELIPITPIYRAKLTRLLVKCNDRVRPRQPLAIISNFLVQADYDEEYEDAKERLALARIALDEGVAEARALEEAAHQKYISAQLDADRKGALFASYDKSYRAGAVGKVEWESVREEWRSAIAAAKSLEAAWRDAQERLRRVGVDEQSRIDANQENTNRLGLLSQRVQAEPLEAPVGGYIVECNNLRPDNVIDPGTPLFDIFDPQRAYILAFFSPSAINQLRVGQQAQISVKGIRGKLQGRVVAIYPSLTKLPEQMTRFFWEHVQWSEYRPVRIAFENVPDDVRTQLGYDSQSRVRIAIRRSQSLPAKLFSFAYKP
jgi:multidrug resistance efflux pump